MKSVLARNLVYFPVTRIGGEKIRYYLKEYRKHDQWDSATLASYQRSAAEALIRTAAAHNAYYAQALQQRGGPPSSYEMLDGLPLLDKDHVRASAKQLLNRAPHWRDEHKTTSGSTGHPVTIVKGRDALARERAATWRAYAWAGIPVAAPQALFWGRPHSRQGRLKAGILDWLANRRRLPMFGVTDVEMERYHQKLQRFQPHYLYGYVSALTAYIRFLERAGERLPKSVQCLITTSELLDPESRRLLEESTGLRVHNEYGCGEVGSIAHECEHGRLHIMTDNLILECLPGPELPEGLGELVVTDLHNHVMPLIRYRLGDLGELTDEPCPCGRPYPVLKRIVGRAYDMIYDAAGRAYHPEAVLYVFEDLRRQGVELPPFQAVQRRNGELELRFEGSAPPPSEVVGLIKHAFQGALNDRIIVEVSCVKRLERESSGKLRVVKKLAG